MIMFTVLGYWSDAVATTKGPMDGKTSSFIEQILSSVRIVQSFDMAPKLLRKLQTGMLAPLRKLSKKTSATRALEQAAAYGAGFLVYSLAFWYGGIQVQAGLSVGNFLTVSRIPCPRVPITDWIDILQFCQPVLRVCNCRTTLYRNHSRSAKPARSPSTNRATASYRHP